jgi:hypothetical protein
MTKQVPYKERLNLDASDVEILNIDNNDIEYSGASQDIKEAIIMLRGLVKDQEIGLSMIKRTLKKLEELI